MFKNKQGLLRGTHEHRHPVGDLLLCNDTQLLLKYFNFGDDKREGKLVWEDTWKGEENTRVLTLQAYKKKKTKWMIFQEKTDVFRRKKGLVVYKEDV